jgi:hypothetical protein
MTVKVKKNGKLEYLGGSTVPLLSPLFIDKLYIVLPIPADLHAKTIEGFEKAIKNGWGKKAYMPKYEHSLKLSADSHGEGSTIIQCNPKNPAYRFFRLEFTPSKADLNNLKTTIDHILPGGYANLMANGIVNRIDFTVQAAYINPTDILASHPDMKDGKHFGKDGLIESKYLETPGSPAINKQILLYDKNAEVAQSNKKKSQGLKSPIPDYKVLRIEFRLMKTNMTLKELEALENPFLNLSLTAYLPSNLSKQYDPIWPLFLCSCRYEGVEKALLYFNDEDREHYKNRLKTDGKTDWWDPAKIWQGLPAALKLVTHPKGNNPSLQTIS